MGNDKYKLEDCMTTYLVKTIDPVHIGAGGYRLDYIDNVIVRNHDTTPKIPGTTLSGVARHNLAKQKLDQKSGRECGGNNSKCDQGKCIVCQTYGVVRDELSRKGAVSFSDALLLFFPVSTLAGTVWITTVERLKDFNQVMTTTLHMAESFRGQYVRRLSSCGIPTNLRDDEFSCIKGKIPYLELDGLIYTEKEVGSERAYIPMDFQGNLVVVSEKVFVQTVKRNLEVRTSVAIDPKTGTADEGALFTYQAIPRDSYLYFQVIINIPEILMEDGVDHQSKIETIQEAVDTGIESYKISGVGGMTTRGFGRIMCWKVLCLKNLELSFNR